MEVTLGIQNGKIMYYPAVKEGVCWDLERQGAPGKLSFTAIDDGALDITEGNPVSLRIDGEGVFYGYVFTRKRGKDGMISVTAYDQLRYLKNKDTYVYGGKTAAEVVQMLAKDFGLNTGAIEDTRWVIASRSEDNKTLFDIIQNALDATLINTGRMYVLYDSFGALTLRDVENMRLDLLIDAETAQDFDYSSSIDGETYNQIKLTRPNETTGKRDVYIAKSGEAINNWGLLQYHDTLDDGVDGPSTANMLLELYNRKTRSLSVKGAFGDLRVRAGSSVVVQLDLGDRRVSNYMMVEKVKHTLKEGIHTMDLTLRGGDIGV